MCTNLSNPFWKNIKSAKAAVSLSKIGLHLVKALPGIEPGFQEYDSIRILSDNRYTTAPTVIRDKLNTTACSLLKCAELGTIKDERMYPKGPLIC